MAELGTGMSLDNADEDEADGDLDEALWTTRMRKTWRGGGERCREQRLIGLFEADKKISEHNKRNELTP